MAEIPSADVEELADPMAPQNPNHRRATDANRVHTGAGCAAHSRRCARFSRRAGISAGGHWHAGCFAVGNSDRHEWMMMFVVD